VVCALNLLPCQHYIWTTDNHAAPFDATWINIEPPDSGLIFMEYLDLSARCGHDHGI
jgi:hypothetical protein